LPGDGPMSELGCLFVDMNAFFASVEQQERPALRGRPVAVVPVMAGTSCCIAASYEAKARGVTTGTPVRQARRRCPGLRVVLARPRLYVAYHHRIVEAVESCLHVDAVASVDEMYGRLMGGERAPERAAEIAFAVKRAVKRAAGGEIRCSVGLAANAWLAKVASDMQKPDGMTMIRPEQMPEAITHLALTDLPGIAAPMARRLAAELLWVYLDLYERRMTTGRPISEADLATLDLVIRVAERAAPGSDVLQWSCGGNWRSRGRARRRGRVP